MTAQNPDSGASWRGRWLALGAVFLASTAGLAGYIWHVKSREVQAQRAQPPVTTVEITSLPSALSPVSSTAAQASHYLLYRSTALGDSYGRLGAIALSALEGERLITPMQCERVHFAAGRGICLEARRDLTTTYHAHLFDANLKVTGSFDLAGPPSRARVSPNGQLAAVTVFVTGHSYASTDFTTRTSLIDAVAGTMLAEDLESYTVERDGKVIRSPDFNFWGVTFTRDGRQFYATLGTAGRTLLIRGDVAAKRMTVIRDGVECPSLSPDNLKIAFKQRRERGNSGRISWGLSVLDLGSGQVTALSGETRNVDDQVEWMGNGELLYAMPEDEKRASASTNIWALPVDGRAEPRLLLPLAYSPAVVTSP